MSLVTSVIFVINSENFIYDFGGVMNIPNRLTVLRLIMVPVFFISYMISLLQFQSAHVVSAVMMFICYAVAERLPENTILSQISEK